MSHYTLSPLLSPSVFGFAIYLFDDQGAWSNSMHPSQELHYAIVLNQSLELQTEVFLSSLLQLVYRQVVTRVMGKEGSVRDLGSATSRSDDEAISDVADSIRYGWKEASELVGRRAKDAGLSLEVSFASDPFRTRGELVRRFPKLREIYDAFGPVKNMVDKLVSVTSGADWKVVGGTPQLASWAQTSMQLLEAQRIMNQAARDGEVLGNGYFVVGDSLDQGVFCLLPDEVTVKGDTFFTDDASDRQTMVGGHVLHLKGVEAYSLPYGMSVLEPFVPHFVRSEIFTTAASVSDQFEATEALPESMRVWSREMVLMASREAAGIPARVAALISPAVDGLESKTDLYLPGQDLMPKVGGT